jgi:hypothetical protein
MEEDDDLRYVCSVCGSDEVEGVASVGLNDGVVELWEDADYWCPRCDDTVPTVCRLTAAGLCLAHGRPAAECRAPDSRPIRSPETPDPSS